MKTVNFLLAVIILVAFGLSTSAQTATKASNQTKTESFKVWGKCEMCKARIEKAAKAEGVTSADWNEKTALLTVVYNPSKTSVDALEKKLASVGHDTEKYRASDDVYSKLPGCCHYDRAK
jgi:periplasmic mercuric ion binding protein